jgi:hypothetical protein
MSRQPVPLHGPFAWQGAELRADARWQYHLDPADIDELDAALSSVAAREVQCEALDRDLFPLPHLSRKLASIGEELESGCGIVRLRGLPVSRWSQAQLEMLWMGFACHLGTPVFQNAYGQLLREIRDEGGDVGERYGQRDTVSGTFLSSRARTASGAELRFHTDRCDIVCLLCLREALHGGVSKIASSVAVHNAMLAVRPDLAALLYEGLPRSRMGEEAGGENEWYMLPVWGVRDGKFTSHYSRTYVEAGQLQEGVPRVSEAYWKALDLLAELAETSCMQMTLHAGDMQFVNNHVVYHARTAFEDGAARSESRSLLRIWLSSPSRALPQGHKVLWRAVETGELRGGIGQAQQDAR